ncbi:uncharacterized protein LOC124700407 [Lolium rigidum]|uniref:uncharacterized protein LOC124700407 n=1 Tax=Lolium rigidum TaxID=89674 RepID=UPI001F5CA769|nr:uncharacterized protein LOC124700407 [Lolium rigidum]
MAPSASMLFLSYHQLHHGTAATEAEAAPREGATGAGGFRFSFRNVFSSAVLAPPRRDAAPAGAEGKQRGCHAGGDQEAQPAALGSRFEEAVELSCWSS